MFRLFQRNREKLKKYLLIFFLSIVSIGMVITLAPISGGDTNQMQANVVASIGSSQITTQDLQRIVQLQLNSPLVNRNPKFLVRIANSALDQLIMAHAVEIQAAKLGVEVTDQELLQALRDVPSFYVNGTFIGMEAYQSQVQEQTGMTVAQFEAQMKQRMLLDKVRNIVTDGVTVTTPEAHEEFERRNAKAKVEYVVFDPDQYVKSVEITPAALDAFFKKDPSRYKVAEERRVSYVLIDPSRVLGEVKLDDATLKQYYVQHLSQYRVPERVKVAHILFKTTGKSPAEITVIESTARKTLAEIKAGADFGELAKKLSEDTPSAPNGGEIGWIVRGQTVKEFENTAFAMQPGQVSDLVKTVYGFHIIKCEDKQTAHLQSFDEVKAAIRADLMKQDVASDEQALAQKVIADLRANSKDTMASAASKFGLEAHDTPLFKYNQLLPDFGSSQSFASLSFELRQGEVGEPINLPKGVAAIQVTGIVPEHVPTLEEVEQRVEQDYRQEQSKVLAAQKAQEFATKAKAGDFKKVAKAEGLTVTESADFSRQDTVAPTISGSALSAAFTLATGQTSDPVLAGTKSLVFNVLSHTPANEADFASQQSEISEELLDRKRSEAFEIYEDNLKAQMLHSGQLKMNDSALKQFLEQYQSRNEADM